MIDPAVHRSASTSRPGRRLAGIVLGASTLFAALAAVGCMPGPAAPAAQVPAFDAERAWRDLEKQVSIGTRQAGTPGAEATRAYLEQELAAAGHKPIREAFRQATPIGELDFANIYVDLAPQGSRKDAGWILLCTHYDTKRLPGEFTGANDSASGTAVLLELARAMAPGPAREFGYRFLFLDGEESVNQEWVDPDNRYGSRHHAAKLKASGRAASFKACVLLDMVGDKDLGIEFEGVSDQEIYLCFLESARELKLEAHFASRRGQEVIDDHRIFMNAGIRAVDLIDFNYGPNNSYWHTLDDKLGNCSMKSLETVGRVVLHALPRLEQKLAGR